MILFGEVIGWLILGLIAYGVIFAINHERKQLQKKKRNRK